MVTWARLAGAGPFAPRVHVHKQNWFWTLYALQAHDPALLQRVTSEAACYSVVIALHVAGTGLHVRRCARR